MAVEYIEALAFDQKKKRFIGTIEVKACGDGMLTGYDISKKGEKALAKMANVKHIQWQMLEHKNGDFWLAGFPRCESNREFDKRSLLGHFKVQSKKCNLKHSPCGKQCVRKNIDYPYK